MDCIDVQYLLSDRQGGYEVDTHRVDRALAHCTDCTDCAAFARAISALDAIARPTAPDRAIRRTIEAVRSERVAIETDTAVDDDSPSPGESVVVVPFPGPETREPAWKSLLTGPRIAIFASAAAIFVVAVGLTVNMLTGPLSQESAAVDAERGGGQIAAIPLPPEDPSAPGSAAEDQDESVADSFAVASAPPYVVVDGFVYVVGVEGVGVEVLPTSVGQALTAKGSPGAPARSYAVYSDEVGALYLEGDEPGAYAPLAQVVRMYAGKMYSLTADTPVEAYGDWPALPIYIPTPTSADGSPFFAQAGTDGRNVAVYARVGSSPIDGFAIPPGTSASDPAAGNPNWTWWTPLEQ